MKRKLLFAIAMLFAVAGVWTKLHAQKSSLTTAGGWTKIEALPSDPSQYFFAIYDHSQDLGMVLKNGAHQGNGNWTMFYTANVDPMSDEAALWAIANDGNFQIITNYTRPETMMQTEWNASWFYHCTDNGGGNLEWGRTTFAYLPDGKYWTIQNGQNPQAGYLGPWDNSIVNGAEVALNKQGDAQGHFDIFQISREQYWSNRINAGLTYPCDMTSAIVNPDALFQPAVGWTESFTDPRSNGYTFQKQANDGLGNKVAQLFFESWQDGGNLSNRQMTQTISYLPIGHYQLSVRTDAEAAGAYLMANDKSIDFNTKVNGVATIDFKNESAGTTFGVKLDGYGANWVKFDHFQLTYYRLPLRLEAVVLPSTGDMAANTWYYYDIEIADNNYKATATNLNNIVYSTDGDAQADDNFNNHFTATGNTLEATRYYVKSSSANKLSIAAASYSYEVGAAEPNPANGSTIKPGQTIEVVFQMPTNDPNATVTNNFTTVSFGGTNINVTKTANGFSFVVPATVTAGTAYELTIPAGKIGYTGKAMNATAKFTYNTVAIFDGVYYLANTDGNYEGKYISRGGAWATQSVVEDFGLATYISIDNEGTTTLQFFDNDMYLGDDGFCYTDCTGTRVRRYRVEKVADGYKFLNTANNRYLAIFNGQVVGDAAEGGNLEGATNVWDVQTTAQYTSACYARNAAKQVAAVAAEANLTGITTAAQLEAAFTSSTPISIPAVERTSAENQYAANNNDGTPHTYFEQTVTGLEDGVYKLTFKAMQRGSSYERVDKAEGARGLLYAYANDSKTQLVSVMEQGATTAYASNYHSDRTGLNYPNNSASAYAAFDNGLYENTIYVYVTGGTLKFGIKNPSRLGGNFGTYVAYGDFTLTYYSGMTLASLVETYEAALAAAKVTKAKTDKMAPSLRTALENTITTYDEGRVNKQNQTALETAINALQTATAKAETSIASYAVIASGGIPDDSLDGWTCTNNNTFHINTWSVEGNPGNDPSNMITPFIENWIGGGSQLGAGKIYYRLEGLEPGEKYYAEALVRSYNEASNAAPNGPNFYINDQVTDLSTDGTTFTYNEMSGIYATLGCSATIGQDGVLELGVVIADNRNYNWVAFKNIRFLNYEPGDVNESETLDENDILDLVKFLIGKRPQKFNEQSADVNGDKNITLSDVTKLVNKINK